MTATASPTRWFVGLNGLRAIAALLIVVHHAGFSSGVTFRYATTGLFLSRLDLGVSLFFVLSGFLLFRPFVVAQLNDSNAPSTGAFWIRRVLRVFPGYWLALFGQLAFNVVVVGGISGLFFSAFLVHIYHPDLALTGITQSWSLATELGFYLLLPLIALVSGRLNRGKTINQRVHRLFFMCLGLAGLSFTFRLFMANLAPQEGLWWGGTANLWTTSYLDTFAAGMALSVLSVWADKNPQVKAKIAAAARYPWMWWGGTVVLLWIVSTQLGLNSEFVTGFWHNNIVVDLQRQTIYLFIGVTLLVPVVFSEESSSWGLKILSSRPLVFLGISSYGIYLWHQAFLTLAHRWLQWPELSGNIFVLLAIAFVGSTAAAALSHYLFEDPIIKLGKRFLQRSP
ncbi:MAG TPA: acyltransferase [Acidimicrobiia bacterium]|jgi:peptidoglycan/LPS O-acetylase OafA/YrhL|nr:acyltransferase [Acidimicrobiia bacterium]HIL47332.1 acyltransferase [Acidimicrobiia bacterium]